MPTSTPGTPINGAPPSSRSADRPDRRGFTLVELSVVLFVLGLVLWLALPRLASIGEPDRNAVFRAIAAGSEAAFDAALFEKREVRLVVDPVGGAWRFQGAGERSDTTARGGLAAGLAITGIRVEGEDRPPDLVTEIRYLPGGRVPESRIFFREGRTGEKEGEWTLRINPFDGSVDVLEGTVLSDA